MAKQPPGPGQRPVLNPGQVNFGISLNPDTGAHVVVCQALVVTPFEYSMDLREFLRMVKANLPAIWEQVNFEILTPPKRPLLGPDGEAIG